MKLAVIKHIRCGDDTFERTLVWIPDEMTEDTFERTIATARDEYLDFAQRFKNAEPPNDYGPHSPIPFARYPDRTVADVQAEWAAKKIAWEAWDADRKQARKTLGDYLHGRDGIKHFHEFEPPLTYECDWGHNHGVQLDYDETIYD